MKPLPTFPVSVGVLPRAGFAVRLVADAAAREAIAAHAGVTRIDRLEADLVFSRWRREGVEIGGRLVADLEQACVVTLEPVAAGIDADVLMRYVPVGSELARTGEEPSGELILDPMGDDPPEVFEGDTIDAWAVAIESLILAIDPFPRAPGAELDQPDSGDEPAETGRDSPFAALKNLKTDRNHDGGKA